MLFFSTNDGANWTSINSGLTNTYVYSFAANGTNLFAGTGDGVFLSTNNGTSWNPANTGIENSTIYSMAVIGSNIFAGSHSGGVYLSTNNGTSWTQIINGLTSMQVRALAVIGTNLFAGTYGGGVFLSTNNGTNWTAVNGTLTSNDKYIYSFAVDGSNLYAGSYTGVFLSTNNGTNWTPLNSGFPANLYIYGLGINGTNMFAATGNGIYISTNSGSNWTQVNLGIDPPIALCIAVNGTTTLGGTLGDGIFRSTNNGANWALSVSGLLNSLIVSTSVINSTLYATSSYSGIFASTNSGQTWNQMNNGLTNLYVNDILEFGGNLFAATVGGGVFISTNNGTTWSPVNSGLSDLEVYAITLLSTNLFAGTYGGGVCISTNNGNSWTPTNSGLTNLNVTALLVNGSDIYAGTWNGGVFKSTNNGTNWTEVNTGLTTVSSKQIATFTTSGSNILAGTTEGLYLSSNNGGNWTKITSGISETWISALTTSGTNSFAGTREASVYLSNDNGINWTKISDGFTTSSDVYSLAASSTDLFAGTFGSSVWKRPLSEIIGGPGLASNPSPTSGAVNTNATNLSLSWTNPAGATTNKVLFGTNPNSLAEIHSGSLVTSVNAPSQLDYNTTYYWRVDEFDGSGTSIGNLWSFTTMDNPNAVTLLFDDFESGTGNWQISNDGGTCTWLIFFPPYPSSFGPYTLPPTASGGVFSADATECGAAVLSTATTVNKINANTYQYVEIQFDNDWHHYVSGDQAHVEVSTDSINWNSVWSKAGVSLRNTHETIDISSYVAGNNFWIRLRSVQPGWDYWWVIDNFKVRGWIILPVELTSFTASISSNNVSLNWATSTETNNQGFEIERSQQLNGSNVKWEKIGYVTGFGTTTESHTYSFTDEKVPSGNYSYRLKQIDLDGTIEYSFEIEANVQGPREFALEQNYPNPFNPVTKINFSLAADSKVTLKVYDILGQEITSLLNSNLHAGNHFVDFNAAKINSGVYFYTLEAKGNDGRNFVSTKKMIVIK